MSRKKKVFRNVVVIGIILFVLYYFGGYYFSKEQCVIETMRGLYVKGNDVVMEVRSGNEIKSLVTDDSRSVVSIIGTKQFGFLYHTSDCFTNQTLKKDQIIDVISVYNSEVGQTIFVNRNNKDIAYVEVELSNGRNLVIDNWNDDFAGTIIESDDWNSGIYKAFDKDGNLVGSIEY